MPPPDATSGSDPTREALLYLEWSRGALGRFAYREGPGPVQPEGSIPGPIAGPPTPVGALLPALPLPVPAEGADPLDTLKADALGCRRCGLCETRTTVVFGEGARRPRLMFVGEAPGADEDASGRPFVGKAGQLLTKMIAAIGLAREDVYIANVLKCRPPGNRPPRPDEAAACRPYLVEQIRLLAPELIVILGASAARAILMTERGISSIRGEITTSPDGFRVLPTYHPSYLLRSPEFKREAWLDLQLAAKTLGLSLPPGK